MIELGIKVDLYVNVRESLTDQTIEELIVQTEEKMCDNFLKQKERNIAAYERKKAKQASLVERVIENTYNQVEVSCG